MQAVEPKEDAQEALSRLAVLHHGVLFGYCRRRLGTDSEADDALQETFLRGYKYWASFDQTRDARKWLFGIAHNVCVEVARGRARHRTVAEMPDPADAQSDTNRALENLARQEDLVRVRRELEKMPDRAKRILELKFFGQMTAREIAGLEGMTETAVRVNLHRALETLRSKLGSNKARE